MTDPASPPQGPVRSAPVAGAPAKEATPAAEAVTLPAQARRRTRVPSNRFLARAAGLTAVLTVAGSLLGLVRDQALAHFFGAGPDTDAFLVAWTVPEVASTLLIEDGTALVLVPAFSLALALRVAGSTGRDPVHELVRYTLPRFAAALALVAAVLIAGAPLLVDVLAPGLPDPRTAVDCTRLTATCALTFGLTGYCGAALRTHRRYVSPASIYVAYNIGIITAMVVLGSYGGWGVRSAAAGVAIGGGLMVLVQAPFVRSELRARRTVAVPEGDRPADAGTTTGKGLGRRLFAPAMLGPVLLFALLRQSQVLIERFLASELPAGAISHLNYAQKVAQVPMVMSLMLCTVTFPVVAQALADGDTEQARRRVERDLALAGCIVLIGAATVIAAAPQIVGLLFERGAFTPADTAATADVMRVYALGLLGHTLVGALIRSYFSAARTTWYPAAAMAAGLTVTAVAGAFASGVWNLPGVGPLPGAGILGIAAANALGITVTAVVMLLGLSGRTVPIRTGTVARGLAGLTVAAGCATGAGLLAAAPFDNAVAGLACCALCVVTVFVAVAHVLRVRDVTSAVRTLTTALATATRKLRHVR
ncbi:murein biosynthesis protein MurJ [Streptomyces tsukubensis]|uniref:Murein biosynthesis protein MurJ n=2 Tax=Streptomyces tsukubensis TaxID=83656 RepID=A0A1V4A5F3_9ACTN|nr:murein biosynthesis protein MurJ [Streptomyces tsukubensis]